LGGTADRAERSLRLRFRLSSRAVVLIRRGVEKKRFQLLQAVTQVELASELTRLGSNLEDSRHGGHREYRDYQADSRKPNECWQ
jgi:hypothetical protein